MYKISTTILKGQIPDVSIEQILKLYVHELENQYVDFVQVYSDKLSFTQKTLRMAKDRFHNNFGSFSKGELLIEEDANTYYINLTADLSAILKRAILYAGFAAIPLLIFTLAFNWITLLIVLMVFAGFMTINYVILRLTFPPYFERLKIDVERELNVRFSS